MQHLSRRFSGFVFLYVVIAGLILQAFFCIWMLFPEITAAFNYMLLKLITIILIFLPPLIFIGARRYPFLKLLRVNTFSVKHLFYTIGISVCLFLFIRMLDLLILGLFNAGSEHFSYFSSNFHSIWPYILTSCLIPAFFEVIMFQGVIQSGFQDLKPLRSCMYAGLLFALYIQISSLLLGTLTPFEFIPLTILGFVVSYISFRSGSVLPGMIAMFLYYLFNFADIEYHFYINCLMPLGISENLTVFILALVSVIIGGILLVKMPYANNSRTLRIPSIKKIIKKLPQSRENLQHSWLWKEEDNTPRPTEEEQLPDISAPDERLVYPDDSEKQRKGAGFKIGIMLIIIAVLGDLGFSIYFFIAYGF